MGLSSTWANYDLWEKIIAGLASGAVSEGKEGDKVSNYSGF